jgi:hypothetical protein
MNKRLFTSCVARVPSNYLKTHPHYRAMKRRAALRKAEKAKAEANQGGVPAYSKIDNGKRLVPFRNNNLGVGCSDKDQIAVIRLG